MASMMSYEEERRERNYAIIEEMLRENQKLKKAAEVAQAEAKQKEEELNPNIIGCCWFSGRSTVCVVIVYSPHEDSGRVNELGEPILGAPKAYIASVKGFSEESDMNEAADWGAKFPLKMATELIDMHGGWLKAQKLDWTPKAVTNSPLKFTLKYKGQGNRSVKMCKCNRNPAQAEHTCPYSEDINGDSTSLCDCCHECEQACADDI